MKIVLKGKAGHKAIVLFGKGFGWLRRATTIKGRGTNFRTELSVVEGGVERTFPIPGPVDAKVSASISGQRAVVRLSIVTDAGGIELHTIEKSVTAADPTEFKVKVGNLWLEGMLSLEA